MERFQRDYSIYGSVTVELLDPIAADNRWDECREVRVMLEDGQRYRAGCFRDPLQRGGHWWDEPGMFIVQDLTTPEIMVALDEALQGGAIEQAFELWIEAT